MLEVAYIFDSLGGVGVFARGVRGQDYLNPVTTHEIRLHGRASLRALSCTLFVRRT